MKAARRLGTSMSAKVYFLVTAIVFALVAALHVARLLFGWEAVIGGWPIPLWASWVALVVTGALAFFGFRLFGKSG